MDVGRVEQEPFNFFINTVIMIRDNNKKYGNEREHTYMGDRFLKVLEV